MIWKTRPQLDELRNVHEGSAVAHLGIEVTEVGDDFIRGTMPVGPKTVQPFGLLHGGANAMLAETLASIAANYCVDEQYFCVGMEINCNHVRAVREGEVVGTARPLHLGRRSQVWDVRIEDADGRLVAISRMTISVVPRPKSA